MKEKLEAVNILLKLIGEPPLLNEDDYLLSHEATLAMQQIETSKKKVLKEGFNFNMLEVDLEPDAQGYIAKPPNALVMKFTDPTISLNKGMVFNKTDLTYVFTEAVSCKIYYDEEFDTIPAPIQDYIVALASIVFQRDTINDPATDAGLQADLIEATKEKNIYKINIAKANGKSSLFERNANPTR